MPKRGASTNKRPAPAVKTRAVRALERSSARPDSVTPRSPDGLPPPSATIRGPASTTVPRGSTLDSAGFAVGSPCAAPVGTERSRCESSLSFLWFRLPDWWSRVARALGAAREAHRAETADSVSPDRFVRPMARVLRKVAAEALRAAVEPNRSAAAAGCRAAVPAAQVAPEEPAVALWDCPARCW